MTSTWFFQTGVNSKHHGGRILWINSSRIRGLMAMWDPYLWPRCAATVGLLRSVSDQEFTTQGVTHMTDRTMMYNVSICTNYSFKYSMIFTQWPSVTVHYSKFIVAIGLGMPEYNPNFDVGEKVNIDVAAVAQLANTVFAATRQEARAYTREVGALNMSFTVFCEGEGLVTCHVTLAKLECIWSIILVKWHANRHSLFHLHIYLWLYMYVLMNQQFIVFILDMKIISIQHFQAGTDVWSVH